MEMFLAQIQESLKQKEARALMQQNKEREKKKKIEVRRQIAIGRVVLAVIPDFGHLGENGILTDEDALWLNTVIAEHAPYYSHSDGVSALIHHAGDAEC